MLHLKTPTVMLLSDHPFWQFSCEIYKDTKDVLLEMQAHHGLNVNVILFCYWFSANYQKALSKNDIKQLLTAIHRWHENTIRPLRALRNSLNKYTHISWANAIRREALDAELLAERIEQSLIVDRFAKERRHIRHPNTQKAVLYAFRSIRFYCEVLYITLSERDCSDFIYIAEKMFSDLKKEKISALGYRMLKRPTKSKIPQPQHMNLELFK